MEAEPLSKSQTGALLVRGEARCVQGHGVVLILSIKDLSILQVSENSSKWLGMNTEALLGRTIGAILGEELEAKLRSNLNDKCFGRASCSLGCLAPNELRKSRLEVSGHVIDHVVVLELEGGATDDSPPDYQQLISLAGQFQEAKTVPELATSIVQGMRNLLGTDRVMVHCFQSGEIIAESKAENCLESGLGQRFPGHVIPTPVWVRYIPDIQTEMFEMVPPVNPETQLPSNMNLCSLRGVSLLHRKWLESIEIRSTITFPLRWEGHPWGLIICHHREPYYISQGLREAAHFLYKAASQQLRILEDIEQRDDLVNYGPNLVTALQEIIDDQHKALDNLTTTLEDVTNNIPILISYWTTDLICEFANSPHRNWVNRGLNLVGRHIKELFDEEAWALREPFIRKVLETEIPQSFELSHKRPDGSIAHTLCQLVPKFNSKSGTMEGFYKLITDLSVTTEINRRLFTAESRFKEVFYNAPIPMGICSLEKGAPFLAVNARYCEMLGYTEEELLGLTVEKVSHPDDVPVNLDKIGDLVNSQNSTFSMEKRYIAKSGRVIWTLLRVSVVRDALGRPIHTIGQTLDITERKMAEDKLRQMQKMEVVGQLAGGIAHEFNNFLAATTVNLSLIKDAIDDVERHELLTELEQFTDEAAKLTKNLLAFSRQQPVEFKLIQINMVIERVLPLVRKMVGSNVSVELRLGRDLVVNADPGMIDQIIMNLAVNSRDALPGGGKIRIGARAETISKDVFELEETSLPTGEYVCITFSDTGTGMTEETLKHIFEPFFTTKGDKGSGMGLSIVHGLVSQHKGAVTVASKLGFGSEFKIWIPRAYEKQAVPNAPAKNTKGCILYIEDLVHLRKATSRLLKKTGFWVLEAEDGASARQIWKEHREEVGLVLSDIILPHGEMGTNLVENLLMDRPDLAVVIVSGYAKDINNHPVLTRPNVTFMSKPYHIDELIECITSQLPANN